MTSNQSSALCFSRPGELEVLTKEASKIRDISVQNGMVKGMLDWQMVAPIYCTRKTSRYLTFHGTVSRTHLLLVLSFA